MTTVKKLVTIL